MVPSPVQLEHGSRITVDTNEPSTKAFFTCSADGCMSDYDATPELIAKLKNGQTLNVQAINLAGYQILFPVPLADFAKVNAGPPIAPKAFAERQKKPPLLAPQDRPLSDGPLVYSPWTKFCSTPGQNGQDAKAPKVCFTGRDGRTETGVPVVAAGLIESDGSPKKIFRVTVPTPMQLGYGTRIIIDNNESSTAQFFTCTNNQCMSDYQATPELIAKLNNGQTLNVQVINLAGKQIPFPVPLDDFAKVSGGPPMDPKAYQEQQKKLQEALQKKVDGMRK